MNASRFLLGTLLMAAAAHQVQAADMSFSGAADGVDPLGHNYSFNGSTFLLSSGSGTFNPLGTLMGPGTVAASFSLALTGPVTFDTTSSNHALTTATLSIGTGTTFTANNSTLTLTGSGTPFTKTGTFTVGGSTFNYTGSSATTGRSSTKR